MGRLGTQGDAMMREDEPFTALARLGLALVQEPI